MESEVIHVLCAFAKWAMNEKRWRKKWERERAQRKSVYIYMIYREACTLHTPPSSRWLMKKLNATTRWNKCNALQ